MLMRAERSRRILPADVLAATALTLVTLAVASADTWKAAAPGTPVVALYDDGGGRGLPPLPGPTDPNGP
jgi:hypothetical protein